MDVLLSVVTYNDGKFDVIIRDAKTDMEVTFSGNTPEITDEEFDFLNEVAPACVFTKYTRS